MKYLFIITTVFICMFTSCKQNKTTTVQQHIADVYVAHSIAQLDTTLQTIDSVIVVFYNDPLGNDSLKYTRYYKQYSSVDVNEISFIQAQLNDTTIKLEKVKPCRSEGKIWCFSKKDILQTIYFSSYNDLCSHLYIIKNGFFYYSRIHAALIAKLNMMKQKAATP